jgi:hypothetical protein
MGRAARQFYQQNFEPATLARKLTDRFRSLQITQRQMTGNKA